MDFVKDGSLLEVELHPSDGSAVLLASYNYGSKEMLLEPQRGTSKLHSTYQVLLPQSYGSKASQQTASDQFVKFGEGVYLKNLFSEEFLSYDDTVMRDPLLIRSVAPSKMFCFTRPYNYVRREDGAVPYNTELRLCSLNAETFLRHRKVPGHSTVYSLALSKVDYDPLILHRSSLQSNHVAEGFPFCVYAVEQGCFLSEGYTDGKLQLKTEKGAPLISGKFYLEREGECCYMRSMFFNGYLEFRKGRKPQLVNRRVESGQLRLHVYSHKESEGEDEDSVIYYLEHLHSGEYLGCSGQHFDINGSRKLPNALQLRRCLLSNIAVTGFMSTAVQMLNSESVSHTGEFLKSFMVWMRSKLTKEMQLHSQQSSEESDFGMLQREFFKFGLVEKLLQIHALREELDVKSEIVGLIGFLCKNNPHCAAGFLRNHNFIVASFYEEHFDLSNIISLQELSTLPKARIRSVLDECNCLLLALSERGQADDAHPKFLQFLKHTLQLNQAFGNSMQPFLSLLRSSRHIQHFKLASKHEEFTREGELILEIYIMLAGKAILNKLPLASVVTIAKDTQKLLKLRKLCSQYLLVEYLQETYKQPDHVIFQSVEEEGVPEDSRQLDNYVQSLKEYCLGEIRVAQETISDGQTIAVAFILYLLCLGRLHSYELMEACSNLIAIIEEMDIFQEHYHIDYEFLSHSIRLLSRSLAYFNGVRLKTTFREMLKSPLSSQGILTHAMQEGLDLQKLRLQSCVSKICYFVKLSGSNPKNATLFLETQDLLFEYTHNSQLFYGELLKSRVVKEFDVEALQAYALVVSVREAVTHHKPLEELKILLSKLEHIVTDPALVLTALMKIQAILRCLQVEQLLIGVVRAQGFHLGLDLLATCFSILMQFAKNNVVNCKSLLGMLSEAGSVLSEEQQLSQLYRLVLVIVENPLIREVEYLPYLESLVERKQLTEHNSEDFMRLMAELTNSRRPVSIERVVRHLVSSSQVFRQALNVHERRGSAVFLEGTTADYLTLVFQLIYNLRDAARLNRDFRDSLVAVLPASSYELFQSTGKFFVMASRESYQQTRLEALLILVLCQYSLLELLPLDVSFNCTLIVIQSYTSCYRQLRSTHFESVESFFTKHPHLQCLEMDPVIFAAKVLSPLLKHAEDLVGIHEKQLDEDRKQALLRNCRILATEVIACYEGFLTNEEYLEHENIFNESLRMLHRSFNQQPDLKFYYNYNSRKTTAPKTHEEQLCRSPFAYLEKNEAEKNIFLHSVSDDHKKVLQQELLQRQKVYRLVLEDVGEGFVIETLLFCLQEATTSYMSASLPLLVVQESKPSIMLRAAQAIDKLLNIKKQQTMQILLNINFAEMLVNCLGSHYEDIDLLLVIALKMMRGNDGELHLEAQRAFQKAFLGERRSLAVRFVRRVLTDQLNTMIENQGPRANLERHIEMQLNNHQEPANLYLKTVATVQCLCQSLNFQIKQTFGESEHRGKSILALLIELLQRSLGLSLNAHQTGKEPFTISIERCDFIQSTSKCIISLLHGPHRSNIKRALLLGYQSMCVKVMEIEDSLETLSSAHYRSSSLRVFEKGDIQHLKRTEPQFYESYLKGQIVKKENDFNYELIARLKRLSMLALGLMFGESIHYQKPADTDANGRLVESNIINLYEKLRAVYKVNDEELIRLLYNKETKMNFLEKLIALKVFEQEEDKEPQLEDLRPSLSLEYGIYMYNYLFWYYQWKGSKSIANAVYKHASTMRLKRRYNKKIGVLYQAYSLTRDIVGIFIMIFRLMCRSDRMVEQFARLEHESKMTATINFFASNFQTIQIRMEDGQHQSVCFPLVPEARCFNKSIKRDLFRNVDFSSHLSRLGSFMRHVEFTIVRLELEYKLSRITHRNRGLGVIVKYRELWKSMSFFFGFCQNMVLMILDMLSPQTGKYLTYGFRSWQYAMATLLFLVFLFQSARLRLVMAVNYCDEKSITNPIKVKAVQLAYLASDKTFFYAFFYTLLTVIGTYYPLLISLMLLDFFYRFRSTRFLLNVFNKPKWSLLNNIVLFVILLYVYSFIFISTHDVNRSCDNFLQCIQVEIWLAFGLLGSGFLAIKQFTITLMGSVQNILYLAVVLVYQCLFLGIIINQMRKYRRDEQIRKNRVKYQCFICSRSKQTINKLQRSEKGFKKHVELQHNLWNYISYLVYVQKLKPEAMTAQEQYVTALWRVKSLEWLPEASPE